MLENLKSIVIQVVQKYSKYIKKTQKENNMENKDNKIEYETLLPKNNIKNKSQDMLDYAINKENVNNIAITGGYSTGKSSLINSYFRDKENVKVISLATFKESKEYKNEKNDNAKNINSHRENNNIIIQEVEKTIVEKLYYSSYVKKIQNKQIINILISGLINYVFFILIHNPIVNVLIKLDYISRYISVIVLAAVMYFIIYYIVSKISEFTNIKLKIGELEVDTKLEKRNILNENLDMILDIIEETKYKYIVFEDLDRFECPEIFEHLRDLNITINSALNEPVKFIYAVRDDMFENENRTKFFDMIFPVVPYVSYESSGEELYKIIEDYKLFELDKDFITKVCLFVSDIRILKNTLNEYVVYKRETENESLSEKTSFYKNLFSMMLYKNTCSHDFALLQNKEGNILNIFDNVKKYREEEIDKIDSKIEEYEIEKEQINSEEILDKDYFINALITEIKRKHPNNTRIKNEEKELNIQSNMDITIFEDLLSPNLKIYHYEFGKYEWIPISDFLKENLPELYKKYIILKNKEENKIEQIEIKIKECEMQKKVISLLNLKEIIDAGNTSILNDIELGKHTSLVRYLVSEGYINENYSDYINKFYEGNIKANDKAYIISVRSRERLPFNATIDTPKKVIEMLENDEFNRMEIFNESILDTLLEFKEYETKLNIYMTRFQSVNYLGMLRECSLDANFKNKKKLLGIIFNSDNNIWNKIENFILNLEDKINFLKAILEVLDLKILKESKEKETIEKFISKNNVTIDNIDILTVLLSDFSIKYEDLSKIDLISKKIEIIIQNDAYKINTENILSILKNKKIKDLEALSKNYECLQKIENVKEYIDSNINEYINNVYLKLDTKQNNSEETLIYLLNLKEIDKELIEKILQNENVQIKDIEKVNDELWDMLLDNEKIESDYENINKYYYKNGLNENLINYINKKQSIKEFLTLNEGEKIEKYLDKKLIEDIISEDKININIYKDIILNAKTKYNWLKVSHLEEEKVIFLMDNNIFEFNLQMYNRIRKCSAKIFILYTKKYIRNIQSTNIKDIDYNINEINALICSDEFTPLLKSKVIGYIKDEDIDSVTDEMIKDISDCILRYNIKNTLSEKLLMKILNVNKHVEEKVKIIVYNARLVKIDNVEGILKSLGANYLKIIQDRTTPVFKYTIYNKYLISIIEKLGYNIVFYEEDDNIKLRGTKRGNPAV